MLIDQEIRSRSANRQSLDDLMRDLFKRSILDRSVFDNEELFRIIEQYTSSSFIEHLRRIVHDGQTVVLPANTYGPCLRLRKDRLGPYEIGFDLETSMNQKSVSGVVKNSAAYRAGLRSGQKLLGWKIVPNKIRRKVELVVADGEKDPPRTISYLPQGKAILIQQFVPGPNPKSCPELL
jgi:predicted metalloprotease with PDZ domain